jgi:hypothetical protein
MTRDPIPPDHPLHLFHLPRALAHLRVGMLALHDADQVLAMRRHILTHMAPSLQFVEPELGLNPSIECAWANKHLGARASTIGLFNGDSLIAFACLLRANASDPDDPGHLLGMRDHDWHRSAHMAACFVHEDYRGMHLQAKLLKWRRLVAESEGLTLLLSMTACGNTYSRRNMLNAGMYIRWIGERRPQCHWYGLELDLEVDPVVSAATLVEWVESPNLERQKVLIDTGYLGIAETTPCPSDRRKATRLQFMRRSDPPGARAQRPTDKEVT